MIYGTFVAAALHQVAYAPCSTSYRSPCGAVKTTRRTLRLGVHDDPVRRPGGPVDHSPGRRNSSEYSEHAWTGGDFAQEVSPEAQRFYNFLCMAYGADPLTFRYLAGAPSPGSRVHQIPTDYRIGYCPGEFAQVRQAFDLRIAPFIDPDLLTKVRATQWLTSDEVPAALK